MGEQERYRRMLEKVIDATENKEIQTSEELIRTLVDEITDTIGVRRHRQIVK